VFRSSSRARLTAAGLLTAAAGIAILVWQLRAEDLDKIWAGIRAIGWMLAAIIALGGARFAVRALAWSLCVDPPARLKFTEAFAAIIVGDALGNVLPLGPIVSEPAKAAYVRERTELAPALASLAVENVIYTLSVGAMIAAGMIALLFTVDLPGPLRARGEFALAIIAVVFAIALWVLWRQPALVSRVVARLTRPGKYATVTRRVEWLEQQIYSFASRRRDVLLPVIALEASFHALGVLEMYVTLLYILPGAVSLPLAFVLEAANRVSMVIFKFVPLRSGVDETFTGAVTRSLGYDIWSGTTLALVRKIRMIFWAAVGGTLLARRGLTTRKILEDRPLGQA
jgi:hypothetical protein